MDQEKISKFLKELRTEAGLTQQELADKIYIGRQAISKWERGITRPDFDTLLELCKVFDVEISEILAGERNKNYFDTLKKMYNRETKSKKTIFKLIITLIVILLFIVFYFFITNYNAIKVYTISGQSNNTAIENGILVSTRNKIYFKLGDITTNNKEITDIKLYYLDKNREQEVVYECNNCNNVALYDYYNYDMHFEYTKLKELSKDFYVELHYGEEDFEVIKLSLDEDFSNDIFAVKKHYKNNNEEDNDNEELNLNKDYEKLIEYIKDNFKENKDGYTCKYKVDNTEIKVDLVEDSLNINLVGKDKSEFITFQMSLLTYETEDKTIKYNYNDNTCLNDDCENNKEYIKIVSNYIQEIIANCE